jgi:hypothetical protein
MDLLYILATHKVLLRSVELGGHWSNSMHSISSYRIVQREVPSWIVTTLFTTETNQSINFQSYDLVKKGL